MIFLGLEWNFLSVSKTLLTYQNMFSLIDQSYSILIYHLFSADQFLKHYIAY